MLLVYVLYRYVSLFVSSIEMTSTYLVVFPLPDVQVSSYVPQIVVMVPVPLLVSSLVALIASVSMQQEPEIVNFNYFLFERIGYFCVIFFLLLDNVIILSFAQLVSAK